MMTITIVLLLYGFSLLFKISQTKRKRDEMKNEIKTETEKFQKLAISQNISDVI